MGGASTILAAMAAPLAAARSLLLVTGPGNSGESLLSGLAVRLGWVEADATGVHGVLLEESGLDPDDPRPQAGPLRRARAPARRAFASADRVVVSAPGGAVLLGHHLAAANQLGAQVGVVVMVRHPADAVTADSARGVAGWLNVILGTELATRTLPRALVQREELLEEWQEVITVVEKECGVLLLGGATLDQVSRAGEVVDLGLPVAAPDRSTLHIPGWLRDLAADGLGDLEFVDSLRTEYAETYVAAEAMAAPSRR
jgi:hypothetical protein